MNLEDRKIKICIITPTWNNEDYTIRCFNSIAKNTKVPYKIIWVDNASERNSREKVRNFLENRKIPYEAILNDENKGFVGGTNQGIKKALEINSPYVVFQNNDTEVFEGWDEKMIKIAESDPEIGIVGPITSPCESWQSVDNLRLQFSDLFDLPEYKVGNHENFAKIIGKKYQDKIIEVEMVAFFLTLLKIETVRQIGMLSSDFGIGFGDDDDYCFRSREQKWKIVLAEEVFVFHNHRTTFKKRFSDKKIKSMQNSNMDVFKKKHRKSSNYKNKNFYYYKSLFKKGWGILRRNGLKTFFRDLINFIKHGRKYF